MMADGDLLHTCLWSLGCIKLTFLGHDVWLVGWINFQSSCEAKEFQRAIQVTNYTDKMAFFFCMSDSVLSGSWIA
jgi:hypothetical protein